MKHCVSCWRDCSKLHEKYASLFTSVEFVFLAFLRSLIGLESERCAFAWRQCPRACLLIPCARQVNATNSHQCRLWTVKPSVAGTGSSVPFSCYPLGEHQKDATGRQIDFDLFCFRSLHCTLYYSLHGFLQHLGFCVGFWFACWNVNSDCLQVFTAFDSVAHTRLLWGSFVLDSVSVALRNPAL